MDGWTAWRGVLVCCASIAWAACSSPRSPNDTPDGGARDGGARDGDVERDARQPVDAARDAARDAMTPAGPRTYRELWTYARDGIGSAATPLVANLNDDNGDGRVDVCDDADIVLVAYEQLSARAWLVYLDGKTGRERARSSEAVMGFVTPAVGDLDGDGALEVVTISPLGSLLFFDGDAQLVREGDGYDRYEADYGAFSIANLDGAGAAEIVFGNRIYDAAGKLLRTLDDRFAEEGGYGHTSVALDLDGDGALEVVLGRSAFRADGSVYYRHAELGVALPSVADLDGDGLPEIVLQSAAGITLLDHTGAILQREQRPLSGPEGSAANQRPACIADLDGDGAPELGVSAGSELAALNASLGVSWRRAVADRSGSSGCAALTGSAFFYADEQSYFGFSASGEVVITGARSSVTAIETPVVADIDGNGSPEILLVGDQGLDGNGTSPALRVLSASATGRATRRIWNQHAYHISNVSEDGRIPMREPPHWLADNSFRANGGVDRGAPSCGSAPAQ